MNKTVHSPEADKI